MQQYEEELKTLRQQILALQALQEHLADIRESWKEEQLRRKAADEALDQMK